MQLSIQFIPNQGKDGGIIEVLKKVENDLKKVGEIKYEDDSDKRWLIGVLTDGHPNVAIVE